ncbi:nucleotidyltransferase family protein [Neogemmobacter tilapiae]|uniref:Nucleotidyltransferase n=1 Tax=Neogemmobacter tilapiae TaxID=875041 RepID=A0A918TJY1_9RHOB|nr:nucleotidyltransferase family protein [Gemmobacter tilapiae]GHC51580.1 nucleotidyltransferase [Gemmobacter tilapiae]
MRAPPLMLFAAGFGTRMGTLTADRPKPLIPVAGKPLMDHALDLADAAKISKVVVNLHYRGDQIREHLAARPILFSDESDLILETGGGLRAAMPLLQESPVIVLNSDAVWTGENPLLALMAHWRAEMGALLTLIPVDMANGHSGHGDFVMDSTGKLQRGSGAQSFVYAGAMITRTEGLPDIAEQVFSVNRLWDRQIEQGQLFGYVHQGQWCDVGRPEGIALAEGILAGQRP